jgi:TraM recognition site of TraD and TraG
VNINWWDILADRHGLIFGGTRKGKSFLLVLIVLALLRRGYDGITAIDPHGSFVRRIIEHLAHPANRLANRNIIIIDPASSHCVGLNPLAARDPKRWEDCHDAAGTLVSVVENKFGASPDETPRLAGILYCGGVLCAHKELTPLDLLELLSLGGDALRRSLLQDFDNTIVRRQLEDLHTLAAKHPARFLELVESTKNRFVRWLGDKRLARILGQKRGLDPHAIMDGRYIVLADYSSLSYEDAAFLGAVQNTMYFTAARQRTPMRCAPHRLILDEGESLLVVSSARMCDQTAKYGLFLYAAIQRLGQLRARGDFLMDALLENCPFKASFGIAQHESARFLAELFYTGHIDLEAWVPSSSRPVAVGNEKRIVQSSSIAEHQAEHEAHSHTRSHSFGEALGTMSASSSAAGEFTGVGENAGVVLSPPAQLFGPSAPNASMMQQYPLSESTGESTSRGTSEQSATSSAESTTHFDMHGEADTVGHGSSRGTSRTQGESEVFTTVYEWMPSQRFSLEEMLHKLTGEIMTLPRRELFLKIDGERPLRTRTVDVHPEFRSPGFARIMLPAFRELVQRRSPIHIPGAEVDAQIAARLQSLQPAPKPDPDFSKPEPLPANPVDNPLTYAQDFVKRRTENAPKPSKPKSPRPKSSAPGRRPRGGEVLGPKHDLFRIIDGDGGDNEKKK